MRIKNSEGKVFEGPDDAPIPEGYTKVEEPQGNVVTRSLGTARAYVNNIINKVDTLGGILPGSGGQGMIPADAINPIPGSTGDALALAAALATGGRSAGIRMGAPAAAGLATDLVERDPDAGKKAAIRLGGGMLAEGAGQAANVTKLIAGKRGLQQPDIDRVTGAVNETTDTGAFYPKGSVPKVAATAPGIARAGEAKPGMGNPTASGSLEAAVDTRYKQTLDRATDYVGEKARFRLPGAERGEFVSLREALDDAAGLRNTGAPQGAPGTHGGQARAQAQITYDEIAKQLRDQGFGGIADGLIAARRELAVGMSAARLVSDARSGAKPIITDKGKLDAEALQKRFDDLVAEGKIDAAVRDKLEAAVKRGVVTGADSTGVLRDIPGEFKTPFFRFGRHGVTAGENPSAMFRTQLPRYAGTPENLGSVKPISAVKRAILGGIGQQGLANIRDILRDAPAN